MDWGGLNAHVMHIDRKEKTRKDYAFRRQFNEKPSIIPGCPGYAYRHVSSDTLVSDIEQEAFLHG